jgi:hypothetical protein
MTVWCVVGVQFSALETDFMCRLVYVQDVELATNMDLPVTPPPGEGPLYGSDPFVDKI